MEQAKTETTTNTNDTIQAEIERLRRENAMLKSIGTGRRLSMKVAAKGGLSVYGLGRFPVTLYAAQWQQLLGDADNIKAFIEANKGALKWEK